MRAVHSQPSSNSTMALPSGETLTASNAQRLFNGKHQQLVYYAVCNSGANYDKNNGGKPQKSLVDATYNNGNGAKCVIGFRTAVTRAEGFLLNMLDYTQTHKYATIAAAKQYAIDKEWERYRKECHDKGTSPGSMLPWDNPGNINNLHVVGNQNVILDLRYA